MCGFIGIISKSGKKFPEQTLEKMASMIIHRGPDDKGFLFHENWLALGFRRLSILDLSQKGHQPMLSSDGRYAIVHNGEVYNYREIREELKVKGYKFISDTDTEVILAAYQCYGKECVRKFIGMFSFMIVDMREKSAFIVCDPLGIKPLFFYEDNDYFIFCSEVKTLLPYCSLDPNLDSINEYLVFSSVIGRDTLFKNVFSLPQGHLIECKNNTIFEEEYFHLSSTLQSAAADRPFKESCEQAEALLKESIKIHLRSDVELGVQLSGGVDSSLITAIASQLTGKKIHSFSISFKESSYDESEYQKRISQRYATEHHDYQMDEDNFTDLLYKATWHYEHPLNDPNSVATYYLTKQAKQFITVMLTGEGADESFMGYARFFPDSIRRLKFRAFLYRHSALRELLSKIWPLKKGKSLLNIACYNPAMYVLTHADLNTVDKLLKGQDSGMRFRRGISESARKNVLHEAILQDEMCNLIPWFWRADRMGMASSMELRVPFCSIPMFKIANSIPYKQKVHNGERKAILKKVAEKYMDYDQIYRKKIGFGIPVDKWINAQGRYNRFFTEIMESKKFQERPFINHKHFDDVYNAHKNGSYREINSAFLWTYFNLELWYRTFFEEGWRNL